MGFREDILMTIAERATYGGAAVSLYGGYTANEIAAFGGLACAIIGLIYNIYRGERSHRSRKTEE